MDIQSRISTTDSRRASLISVLSAKGCSISSSAGLSVIPNAISLIQGGPSYDDMVRGNFSVLSGSASYIASYAFKECGSLTSISFPNCVSIGSCAFYRCLNLSSVNVYNCQYIEDAAFGQALSLSVVDLPHVTDIGESAFDGCSALVYVHAPLCSAVGSYAFNGCTSLESIRFNHVSSIGDFAFVGCENLSVIKLCYSGIVSVETIEFVFMNTPIDWGYGKIFVPDDWYGSYIADPTWGVYSEYIHRMSEESD